MVRNGHGEKVSEEVEVKRAWENYEYEDKYRIQNFPCRERQMTNEYTQKILEEELKKRASRKFVKINPQEEMKRVRKYWKQRDQRY